MEKKLKAKPIVKDIYDKLAQTVNELDRTPNLLLISVGEDPVSAFYIRNIIKKAAKIGIEVNHNSYKENISIDKLLNIIKESNNDSAVDAIMVQKPLPDHIDDNQIAEAINPFKDVDGFSPVNLGKLVIGTDALLPCTPAAVMALIKHYNIEPAGKHTVLCGRSLLVGKPLLNMLIKKQTSGNATVTVCHSRTANLRHYTSQADILITALGIARFIKQDDIKRGAIIIDVGTNEIEENGKTIYVGDVDYEDCYDKAAAITPVPGGIGSITTAMLMHNIVTAAKNRAK